MPPGIHIEIWIGSRILGADGRDFSRRELMRYIRETFEDSRPGVSTHISSHCVASQKADPAKYRYLTRVGRGRYRVYQPGDPTHQSRADGPIHPSATEIPPEYLHLLDEDSAVDEGESSQANSRPGERIRNTPSGTHLAEEDDVTRLLLSILQDGLDGANDGSGVSIQVEGRHYRLMPELVTEYSVGGVRLTHKSDLVIVDETGHQLVSIEVKFKSAVTDAFKARAYDMRHMKRAHPDLRGVMIYVKSREGIKPQRAEGICYAFDMFFTVPEALALDLDSWKPLVETLRRWLGG